MAKQQMDQQTRDRRIIGKIIENYVQLEKSIVGQLNLDHDHGTTLGSFREEVWLSLFQQIIPQKFSIAQSVFIMDSKGHVSNEVDLAIFDEQYTPYIFRYGRMKFIPIEAVAAVVECKSQKPNTKQVFNWVKSITKLKTSLNSIVRVQSGVAANDPNLSGGSSLLAQTATRPIRILCHASNMRIDPLREHFDFILHPGGNDSLKIELNSDGLELDHWYRQLNHADSKLEHLQKELNEHVKNITMSQYQVTDTTREISLLTLIFQLNQLLMLINNPLPFPHREYVRMFNESLKAT